MLILLFFLVYFVLFGLMAAFRFVTATSALLRILWPYLLVLAGAIAFLVVFWRYLRAVYSRLRFVSRLRKVCRKGKMKCKIKMPSLLSLFFRYRRSDIRVVAGDKVYSVKYFGGNVLRRFIHLQTPERAESSKFFVMPVMFERYRSGFGTRVFGKIAMMRGKFFINALEYGRKKLTSEIEFEENAEPILLFSPSPMRITGVVGNAAKPLGSAEQYQGVTIYEAEGFLRFLSRIS